ncbi:sigma-54-dependent Fis family transcriptional regulator [Pseudonocardia sp. WMMC193]|uniref:sigma-54-dependent Fis family transcriptional regulator n=1 Tax=Pseudonocardia sp. WMMC193 TaxID=2911965 RepID=UPI001F303A1C|nr:helix-turn-helix domain-containing protein [Pseudonocardia sp. WMMC193]MCF7550708.1 Fis family transcriptional regulator [Pseudonocardia sp. WMMC193]
MGDAVHDLPVLSDAERSRIRLRREALVSGGPLSAAPGAAGVPRHIEQSWRRCLGDDVPVGVTEIDFRPADEEPSLLLRAAVPVLDRLAAGFGDMPVAMVLSDATGRIVLRHAALRRQRDVMDRACAAEGFDFSERSVGTNGIGTVLVERRTVLVRGPEHYNPLLEGLTCASSPISEPGTGRLVGTFSLACSVRDGHPLMTVMASDTARQVEDRLLDDAGDRRRVLIEAHLALGSSAGPVLVVDAHSVLANRPGLLHTGPAVHGLLWPFLSERGLTRPRRMAVPLADGLHEALVEPIQSGVVRAFCVRLSGRTGPRPVDRLPPGAGAAAPPTRTTTPRARLHELPDIDRRLGAAVRHREVLALSGPSGSGKLCVAMRVLRALGATDPLVVEPHRGGWFDEAEAAAERGRGLVLRRVHMRPAPTAGQIEALVARGAPLALTADLGAADDAVLGLVRRFASTIALPGLSHRREHLPSLVEATLAELPPPESSTRFSPDVWTALLAWHWPGNLAELHTTVVALARRTGGGTVEIDDLPDELRVRRPASGLLESAEREAVAEALRQAGGNRSTAARALGVGRNTLYRKMRRFGLS